MISDSFEIFHYRDPKMREVPIHHHDFYEFYFFLGGEVEYRVEGKNYDLKPGDILMISPDQFHQPLVKPNVPYERIVIWIDKDYLTPELMNCFTGETDLIHLAAQQYSRIYNMCREILDEMSRSDDYSPAYRKILLSAMLINISRIIEEEKQSEATRSSSGLTSQILSYISENFRDDISLDSLADQFYVSKFYLSHRFSEDVGMGIYKYIISKRLQFAVNMLDKGIAPQQAAMESGFTDYTNFYRSFKKEYGLSPRDYASRQRSS